MDTNNLRYKFEALMQRDFDSVTLQRKTRNGLFIGGVDDYLGSEYVDPGAQLMWSMFSAGAEEQKKNISVTLPTPKSKPDGYYDAGYNEGILDCRRALTSSGVKVKN
ncbi:hypothetical protein ABQ366_06790 [Serratia fonticola]|uniref:hypothetical protein n=1 Tax=Serratia fonticola TaxID=47917 RepID=UPI003AABCCB2